MMKRILIGLIIICLAVGSSGCNYQPPVPIEELPTVLTFTSSRDLTSVQAECTNQSNSDIVGQVSISFRIYFDDDTLTTDRQLSNTEPIYPGESGTLTVNNVDSGYDFDLRYHNIASYEIIYYYITLFDSDGQPLTTYSYEPATGKYQLK